MEIKTTKEAKVKDTKHPALREVLQPTVFALLTYFFLGGCTEISKFSAL